MIRVLIVAAYASVRAGLHAMLAEAEGITVLGAVSGSGELERLLAGDPPDVVLLDDLEGEAAQAAELLASTPTGLVILGDSRGGGELLSAADLQGWAYLRKDADGAEIAGALHAVAAGLVVLDGHLASLLLRETRPAAAGLAAGSALDEEGLTPREREVLQLMADGLPNKQIGARLNISLHTVKFHVASILSKLGAASRTEAVTLGARRGLVTL